MELRAEILITVSLVFGIMIIVSVPLIIILKQNFNKQKKLREDLIQQWNEFVRGQEISDYTFIFIRQISLKQYMGANAENYECEGCFIIADYSQMKFLYSESKRLFNSIFIQLKGRGNKELSNCMISDDLIKVKAFAYRFLSQEERSCLKEKLIKEYCDKGLIPFGKKSPVEKKTTKPVIVDAQSVSHLHHKMSVTGMVKNVKQPLGGYIKPSSMEKTILESPVSLHEQENIHPSLTGLVVDYLSRYMMGDSKEGAFQISLLGAELYGDSKKSKSYLSHIVGLDDESIISSIKLVSYDCVYRAGPHVYVDQSNVKPTKETIENIREMVNRTIEFWKIYGPITVFGPTFEGGYTNSISSGDGDYLSKDTIWDYKVSANRPNSKQTLQLLIYYLLGLHSVHEEYKNIKYLGIYNPRLNIVYRYPLNELPEETIHIVEKNIIGY